MNLLNPTNRIWEACNQALHKREVILTYGIAVVGIPTAAVVGIILGPLIGEALAVGPIGSLLIAVHLHLSTMLQIYQTK